MDVIGKLKIVEFYKKYVDSSKPLQVWLTEAEDASWQTPHDIKNRYASASILKDNHFIFNIKGNNYRIDTIIDFQRQIIYIERVGTHKDYNKWKF